jgi:hypothetical protein
MQPGGSQGNAGSNLHRLRAKMLDMARIIVDVELLCIETVHDHYLSRTNTGIVDHISQFTVACVHQIGNGAGYQTQR